MKFVGITAALLSSVSAFSPSLVSRPSSTVLDATRKPFISGNWKLNPQTKEEATTLAKDIAASITDSTPDSDVALFVPYVFIETAMNSVDGKINVGAEVRGDDDAMCSGSHSNCITVFLERFESYLSYL